LVGTKIRMSNQKPPIPTRTASTTRLTTCFRFCIQTQNLLWDTPRDQQKGTRSTKQKILFTMRRSRLQRFLKLTILWVVLLQAVVVVVIMVALLQGNDKQDETISISSLSSIPRRLQFINGEWYANQCSGGSNLYCWARQPRGGQY
jgi:hypothetical protein